MTPRKALLAVLAFCLFLLLLAFCAPQAHADEAPADLYWSNQADASWPVQDQVRRWDKSDRITLHEIADCAQAPGPCVTITSADLMPSWYPVDQTGYSTGTAPVAATWFSWTINGEAYAETPGRSSIVLTHRADDQWNAQGVLPTLHAGVVCHELAHWILQKGNDMHQIPYGCASNIGTPHPGKVLRSLIPNWKVTP